MLLAWVSFVLLGAAALLYASSADGAVVGIFATLWISAVVFFLELSRNPRRAAFGAIVGTPFIGILCIGAGVAAHQIL
jgi:hypothetical protein